VIDPYEKGVITRTQSVCCRGSPKPLNISEEIISSLPIRTVESLSKLEKYQIPAGVIERLKQKKPFEEMTDDKIKEIVGEFKKFIAILVINHEKGTKVEMVGELVDEVWHTFILFTNEYRKFCDTMVGEYIHHEPNVKTQYGIDPLFPYKKKKSTEFFYEEYEKYFGHLPEIWKLKTPDESIENENKFKTIMRCFMISIAILITTILIWQYFTNIFFAQIEALLSGLILVIASCLIYKKTKAKMMKDEILHGTIIIGVIILALSIIFAFICKLGIFAHMLVLLYIGTGLSIIESSSKSERKPRVGRWGGCWNCLWWYQRRRSWRMWWWRMWWWRRLLRLR